MIKLQGQQAFHVDLDAFAKKLGLTRKRVYQRTALEIWNGVTTRTPVDTGRARSSWNLSHGIPSSETPPRETTVRQARRASPRLAGMRPSGSPATSRTSSSWRTAIRSRRPRAWSW